MAVERQCAMHSARGVQCKKPGIVKSFGWLCGKHARAKVWMDRSTATYHFDRATKLWERLQKAEEKLAAKAAKKSYSSNAEVKASIRKKRRAA